MNFEIETYEENGIKYVFLSHDGSSGVKEKYATEEDLAKIISDYVLDALMY